MKRNTFNQWLKKQPKFIKFLVTILLIGGCIFFGEDFYDFLISNTNNISTEQVTLKRVVDADTIIVTTQTNEDIRVRLIGIDAPESVHPDTDKNTVEGEIASNYTKQQLKKGQTLYLEFDEERQDQYGRTLAYVWLTNDFDSTSVEDISNHMYNAKLIVNGYAIAKRFPPNTKYADIFDELEQNE